MPLNLIKKYSDLLEIIHLNGPAKKSSLMGVFKRDIEDNEHFKFRSKQIRPIKKDGIDSMETLYHHLTTRTDENNKESRSFELQRSQRLHWIRFHVDEVKKNGIDIFSYEDRVNGKDTIRTYIFDMEQEYVIILEPQRSGLDYYLLTAYYLNESGGKKQIQKKQQRKLPDLY